MLQLNKKLKRNFNEMTDYRNFNLILILEGRIGPQSWFLLFTPASSNQLFLKFYDKEIDYEFDYEACNLFKGHF